VSHADAALVGRALRACVRQRPDIDVERVVAGPLLRPLIDAGRYHRVLNLIHLGLAGLPLSDGAIAEGLQRYYLHQVGHHLRAVEDLATLAAALDAHGVPWLLVKGPVLSEVLYERADLRVYNDLDVVIDRGSFPEAIEALRSSGFDLLDRNWELIRREGRAQLHLSLRLGTVADVHHHLLNRAVVRDSLSLPMDDLFGRARTVAVGSVQVRTLDPVDTLLHLCVHAALAGGQRLLWLKDVERSVAGDAPPWDEVVRRARRWRAASLAAVVLSRARDQLGVTVPPSVLRSLFASPVRASVTSLLDRAWPPDRATARVTAATLWSQIVRDGWGATASSFVRRTSRPLLKVTGRRDADEDWAHPPGPEVDHDHGRASSPAAYLRDVADDEPPPEHGA
jgi:hypothetical protein